MKPNRNWIGPLLLIAGLLLFWLSGCGTLEYTNPQGEHLKYTAVFREIKADPNGAVEIKTSPSAEPILTGIAGLIIGIFI